MTKFIRETSLTLFDDILVHCSIGTAGQVNFDSEHCLNIRKKYRPKRLTMVHIHPDHFLRMSTSGVVNDRNMVQGWALAFGIPIIFIIICKTVTDRKPYTRDFQSKKPVWAFIKYVVKLEKNKPIIYESVSYKDFDEEYITGILKSLALSSTNSWLNNFNFYKLKRKIGKRIKISKLFM